MDYLAKRDNAAVVIDPSWRPPEGIPMPETIHFCVSGPTQAPMIQRRYLPVPETRRRGGNLVICLALCLVSLAVIAAASDVWFIVGGVVAVLSLAMLAAVWR